ncbi:unnamed protein product [Microthlaspi erraticum]|uniref:Uncharacterized protein n=1 Tax=Microthlaspi erraticum TaxID=1685480 RepID=A0A6D2I859_9BRAS|nr:unnamed protein product [Microthlaspi erraticum]
MPSSLAWPDGPALRLHQSRFRRRNHALLPSLSQPLPDARLRRRLSPLPPSRLSTTFSASAGRRFIHHRLPATLRRIRLDGSTKKPLRTSGGSRLTRNRSNRLIAVIHGDALSLSVFWIHLN